MKTKRCNKCHKVKNISKFYKDKTIKDGYAYCCKKCRSKYKQKYYKLNKKIIKNKKKQYRENNKEKIQKQTKHYYEKNKEAILKSQKQYYKTLTKKQKRSKQLSYQQWSKKNRKHINEYRKNRMKYNLNYKLSAYLRIRIYNALKDKRKFKPTTVLIGCSIQELKIYLQNQFKKDMNWKNYGKWHVDHIKPCASFDLRKPKEQRKCFHYTNLQPLWAKDNQRKSNKNL